jgi:menaquinol-cytochrome c reductase cytochrome b/c subunit
VNRREKEQYLREYAVLKSKGKPFFPYVIAKDGGMLILVVGVILLMSYLLGGTIAAKADPTSTTVVPRPEWYYYFVFELLRVVKPASLTPLATVGIPTICLLLLLLLPFYDRSPERHPLRRPIATTAGVLTILAIAYLTWMGAEGGAPTEIAMPPSANVTHGSDKAQIELYLKGRESLPSLGCLACHKIGSNGNSGPGPNLTHIADRLPEAGIAQTLRNPTAPMPSYKTLDPEKFKAVTTYLGQLTEENEKNPDKSFGE